MKKLGIPQYLDGSNGDINLTKAVNRARLLDLLHSRGDSSRAFLAKRSGLTKATVSSQIADLIELGIVRETGTCESSMGRKPIMIEIDRAAGRAIGISVSSECLYVAVCDPSGSIESERSEPLADHSPEAVAAAIAAIVEAEGRRWSAMRYGLLGVGIAIPGTVDRAEGRVVRSAKLGWEAVPLGGLLARESLAGLSIGNDATLACIAERELFDPDAEDLVCLFVDEGIGSGAYLNGRPYFGGNGQFGEVGHMTIRQGGDRCPCGNYGCWDLYGSELALRQALAAARGGRAPAPGELAALAAELPAWSRGAFELFVDCHVAGLVSIANALAPSAIVVNSAVFSASPELFARLKEGVAARSLSRSAVCEIRLSSLGKPAPAVGAALSATDRFFETLVLGSMIGKGASSKALKDTVRRFE